MSRKGDSYAQRLRTAQLRAQRGLGENPEWSAEKIAEEWGTLVELVEAIRPPEEWAQYQATHDVEREDYAKRVAEELNRRKVNKAHEAAFKRLVDTMAPKPSLSDRVLAAVRRATGRPQSPSDHDL
jgi:hypothetical protein